MPNRLPNLIMKFFSVSLISDRFPNFEFA